MWYVRDNKWYVRDNKWYVRDNYTVTKNFRRPKCASVYYRCCNLRCIDQMLFRPLGFHWCFLFDLAVIFAPNNLTFIGYSIFCSFCCTSDFMPAAHLLLETNIAVNSFLAWLQTAGSSWPFQSSLEWCVSYSLQEDGNITFALRLSKVRINKCDRNWPIPILR